MIDPPKLDAMVEELAELRDRDGRLFIIGVGGSAANAGHAVNDFRKVCGIEAYAPTDNVAELTARANDDGWPGIFADWLKVSNFHSEDALLVLSVGGGTQTTSECIVEAVRLAVQVEAKVFGIVGRSDGFTARRGHFVVVIPDVEEEWITPLAETFQAVIWHCIVNHPVLKR